MEAPCLNLEGSLIRMHRRPLGEILQLPTRQQLSPDGPISWAGPCRDRGRLAPAGESNRLQELRTPVLGPAARGQRNHPSSATNLLCGLRQIP